MQSLFEIAETLRKMDIQEEMVTFLCSVIAFLLLIGFRNSKAKKGGKLFKHVEVKAADDGCATECVAAVHDDKYYVKIDKALRTAFEKEDYWQVLKCWWQLKQFKQSSIHLSMIIRAMRFCNKGAYFIAQELKEFFKTHPQECSIGLINDLLEPLARRPEDAQFVELLVRMIPSVNLTKDPRTYEIMLTMHASSGNLKKTQEVMAEMKTKEVVFTPRATVGLMTMGLQSGNIDMALKAFVELKPSWDDRDTWPVSMFALEGHKTKILVQVVTLACQRLKLCELSAALDNMTLPQGVLDTLQSKLTLLSDAELAISLKMLEKSGRILEADPIYNIMIGFSISRSMLKSLPAWKSKKLQKADAVPSTTRTNSRMIDRMIELSSDSDGSSSPTTPLWKAKGVNRADSNASTSEGSRSDSEEESNFGPCVCPLPGLAPPPGF